MLNNFKVLLVQPQGVQEGFTRGGTKLPPLGLLYIAAAIRYIADTRLIDADTLELDHEGLLVSLGSWIPDLIGMTVSSLTLPIVSRFASKLKQSIPEVQIIVGGPLATCAPEELLKYEEFDFVGIGDGEDIMSDLCEALQCSQEVELVEGIVSRRALNDPTTSFRPRRTSLKIVSQPAWDMLPDFKSYTSPDCVQLPMTIVEGQRGCPHQCTFCSVGEISGKVLRSRSVEVILEEINYLTNTRGVREISFVDPDFMANPEYALAVSEGILKLGNGITWFCNVRASSVSEPVARKMKVSGCHLVYLGAESGDPKILDLIVKHQKLEQIEDACAVIRNCGIQVSAGFIIGFPFDTDESIRNTIEFAKRLRPAKFQFNIFNWFPGIPMSVPKGYNSIGFHPNKTNSKWFEWQRIAYYELEMD